MLDRSTRRLKDALLTPLAARLVRITPNQLSVAGFLLAVTTAALLANRLYAWGLLAWLLNRLLDGLDGLVARLHRRQSDFGAYFDILVDFAAYALVPLALAWADGRQAAWQAIAFLLATFYLNAASWIYLAALLERANRGAAARGEPTAVVIPGGLVGGFLTIVFYCIFIIWPAWLVALSLGMGVLVLVGVVQRLVWARRNL